MPKAAKAPKIPKGLAADVDKLYTLRARITAEKKRLEASLAFKRLAATGLEARELEAKLLLSIPKAKLEGASGKLATAGIQEQEFFSVVDWDKVFKYLTRTKKWAILGRTISTPAVREMYDDKKRVPGIERGTRPTLSLRKR